MSKRPSIPAEVSRQILIESGHKCAVCGEPCPLERAHITPFCNSQDHTFENLICLCANCHERADKEHWESVHCVSTSVAHGFDASIQIAMCLHRT
ncbi:MAG: HNH endonuclease [Planctomycetes bacterium]|nr:HNH endonuclease [Planctomycetota bacterium]